MVYKKKIYLEYLIKIFLVFVIFYLFFRIIKEFRNSLFFNYRDRVNLIFYQQLTTFVSIGRKDNIHYLVYFNPETKIFVPGGYGYYKIGALGKLSLLEKKPQIIQKAFSNNLSVFIDYFFLPKERKIYTAQNDLEKKIFTPKISYRHLFGFGFQSNTNFFDRIWLLGFFLMKRGVDFKVLKTNIFIDNNLFQDEEFFYQYQGYFYRQTLRLEKKTVQVFYNNFKTAKKIGRIIEGEGIRIVDFTKNPGLKKRPCLIVENKEKPSTTTFFLLKKLNCQWQKGQVNLAEIKLVLSDELDGEWE